MKLQTYLDSLTPEKREQILGVDTTDEKHAAFPKKSVVHASLMGEVVPRSRHQEIWREVMQEKPDLSRQHAVYIHIPFCQTRCLYCGFFQNASSQQAEDRYVDALLTEMARDAVTPQIQGTPIDSVFIGGGTPTSLSVANVTRLLSAIRQYFTLRPDCELTLEGRIHDLVPEKIDAWIAGGVNRISLGIQSFDTTLRRRVGRLDSREEVLEKLNLLRRQDVTIIGDLIFGLPGETVEDWLADVKTAIDSPLDGMDLYQLNVFPGGRLAKAVKDGKVPPCADMAGQADMYEASRSYLSGRGIDRLSICHWRKNDREQSLYNTMAKTGAVVYPFGCGAGGNAGNYSLMLQRELRAYTSMIEAGEKPVMMLSTQVETELKKLSNHIIAGLEVGMVDLRSLAILERRCNELRPILQLWCRRGLMREDLGVYRLTPAGEFWYVTITQSLVECLQAVLQTETANGSADESDSDGDVLDEVLAEMLPESTRQSRQAMINRMPAAVRLMLRKSTKETLRNMLAGLPPQMRDRMLSTAHS